MFERNWNLLYWSTCRLIFHKLKALTVPSNCYRWWPLLSDVLCELHCLVVKWNALWSTEVCKVATVVNLKSGKATPSDSLVSGQQISPEASGRADFLIIVITSLHHQTTRFSIASLVRHVFAWTAGYSLLRTCSGNTEPGSRIKNWRGRGTRNPSITWSGLKGAYVDHAWIMYSK